MTQDTLEKRLREKVPVATPHPGLETRIQARARTTSAAEQKPHVRHLVFPALAVLTFSAIIFIPTFLPRNEPTHQSPVTSQPASLPPSSQFQEPVRREYEGLKKDAQWTMSLVRDTVPSLPVSLNKPDQ